MRAAPVLGAVGVSTDQVRGYREPLEILRLKRRDVLRSRQVGGQLPRVSFEGLSASIE
jgi:hypothetical protein